MKNILLKVIAAATHPVFLPFFSVLIYMPILAKHGMDTSLLAGVWAIVAYLILPLLFFKVVRKVNLPDPDLGERRSIYKAYATVSFCLAIVSFFLLRDYIGFFLGAFLMHILMLMLAFVEMKASWHSAAWSFLTLSGLMVSYNLGLADILMAVVIPSVVLLVVCVVRYFAKAHTFFELGMGIAAGVCGAIPVLFI
ncbi:MAG: hypothetical protein ACPGTP_05375 [Bacteroidia bacterium]